MNHTKEELVNALGLQVLDEAMKEQAVNSFLATLDMRMRQAVSEKLTDEQAEAFGKVVEEQGDEAGEPWLQANVEGYTNMEEEQYQALIKEINENSNLS